MKLSPVLLFLTALVGRQVTSTVGSHNDPVLPPPPPPNDECPGALSVGLDAPVSGNRGPAHLDDGYGFCDTPHFGAPGVWHKIVGNGNQFSADTCGSDSETILHVYQGPSCDALSCIGGYSGSACGLNGRVVFDTVPGETYHILVHGSREGNYHLTVTEWTPPPNDECPGAVSVSLDTPVSGNTGPAHLDSGYDFCDIPHFGAPGVWHKIVGNGNQFSADTCGSDFETILHVYQGPSCDALGCVGGDAGSACGLNSRVIFDTVQGETYHILVHGFREGNYQLTVTEWTPPPNDECPGAASVSLDTPVSGNTDLAKPDNDYDFCDIPHFGAPGVWHKIVGNGKPFSADTCGSHYETILHVYRGPSCDALTCMGGDAGGACGWRSRVIFDTVQGETYHILVHGFREGNYQLSVTEWQPPPPNDECPGAVSVSLNNPVSGNTGPAQPDNGYDFCDVPNSETPGVWYKIVGNGNQFTAHTCGSHYETTLHVYQGACGALTCIRGNDAASWDLCPFGTKVVFDTVPGETYHILVNGFFDAGTYQLTVDDGEERSEGGGDPHFTTCGQCDLVMLKDDNFADGLGIDVHIRTKLVRYWSYIKNVAIRIGEDILEIEGSADPNDDQAHYWINYEYQGELESIAGYPVTQKLPSTYKRSYTIDLSSKYPGQDITVQLYKEFVRVKINGQAAAFGKSVGLMGDYKTGNTLARDGVTVLHDFAELGDEWQILPSDPRLFREVTKPQFPERCIKPEDPRGESQGRLAESEIAVEKAEAA